MAKDPAFLFYPSDFLTGTMFMNNEQLGIYIRLLCSQHQHGGIIDKISFNSMVGQHEIVKAKFIECELGFYNERLAEEMQKRQKKSSNIREAVKQVWKLRKESNKNTMESQSKVNGIASNNDGIAMRPENEDVNEIRNIDKYKSNFENDYVTDEKVCRENGFDEKQLAKAKFEFWNTKELDDEMLGKTYQDVQKHFLNWCRKNKDRIKKLEQGIPQPLPPSRKRLLS